MANFNSGKNLFLVIQLQKADDKKVLGVLETRTLDIFGLGRFAYILHDKDVLDNGEIKGKHLHIVYSAPQAKSSANWVKYFSEALNVEKEAVSVEMMGSERKCLRYLLHLDDGAKHQYDRSEVVTNMDDVCKKAWEANSGFVQNPTLEQLEKAMGSEGIKGIYNLVGMSGFNKALKVTETFGFESQRIKALEERCTALEQENADFRKDMLLQIIKIQDMCREGIDIPLVKGISKAVYLLKLSLESKG